MNSLRVMGIDPGFAIIGWSIIDKQSTQVQLMAFGAITTPKETALEQRLLTIYQEMKTLLGEYQPSILAIEQLYFSTNVKTAIDVAQGRGIILLAAATQHIPVVSYSPLQVKKTLTGDGKAEKRQVQFMVTKIFKMKEAPKPDDVADAVAIGLTHAYTNRY